MDIVGFFCCLFWVDLTIFYFQCWEARWDYLSGGSLVTGNLIMIRGGVCWGFTGNVVLHVNEMWKRLEYCWLRRKTTFIHSLADSYVIFMFVQPPNQFWRWSHELAASNVHAAWLAREERGERQLTCTDMHVQIILTTEHKSRCTPVMTQNECSVKFCWENMSWISHIHNCDFWRAVLLMHTNCGFGLSGLN